MRSAMIILVDLTILLSFMIIKTHAVKNNVGSAPGPSRSVHYYKLGKSLKLAERMAISDAYKVPRSAQAAPGPLTVNQGPSPINPQKIILGLSINPEELQYPKMDYRDRGRLYGPGILQMQCRPTSAEILPSLDTRLGILHAMYVLGALDGKNVPLSGIYQSSDFPWVAIQFENIASWIPNFVLIEVLARLLPYDTREIDCDLFLHGSSTMHYFGKLRWQSTGRFGIGQQIRAIENPVPNLSINLHVCPIAPCVIFSGKRNRIPWRLNTYASYGGEPDIPPLSVYDGYGAGETYFQTDQDAPLDTSDVLLTLILSLRFLSYSHMDEFTNINSLSNNHLRMPPYKSLQTILQIKRIGKNQPILFRNEWARHAIWSMVTVQSKSRDHGVTKISFYRTFIDIMNTEAQIWDPVRQKLQKRTIQVGILSLDHFRRAR